MRYGPLTTSSWFSLSVMTPLQFAPIVSRAQTANAAPRTTRDVDTTLSVESANQR
jgi:hypothetical protein